MGEKIDIKYNLPEHYHDIKEIECLNDSLGTELGNINKEIQRIADNFFLIDMDEIGISRWEEIFSIKAKQSESLQFRKDRVISRFQSRSPITLRSLERILNNYFDKPILKIYLVPSEYAFMVEFMADNANLYKEIEKQVIELKPSNMEHIPTPKAIRKITFKETAKRIDIERNMRLGTTWILGKTPFGEVTNEEVLF